LDEQSQQRRRGEVEPAHRGGAEVHLLQLWQRAPDRGRRRSLKRVHRRLDLTVAPDQEHVEYDEQHEPGRQPRPGCDAGD